MATQGSTALEEEVRADKESSERVQEGPPRWLRGLASWSWRLVAAGALLYILGVVGARLWVAILPVLLGALLASLLSPVAIQLRRIYLPRPVAAALAVLLGISVLVGTGLVIGFGIAREMDQFTTSVEDGYRQVVIWTAQTAGVSADEVRSFIDTHIETLQSSAGSMAKQVVSRVPRVIQGLTVLGLTVIFTWFFVWDGDRQFEGSVALLPERRRRHARAMGGRVWKTVGAYMRGMLVVAGADAVLLGLGLWAIGIPLVMPLMMLMFVSAFVPLVGPVLTGGVACLVALSAGGGTQAGLVILVSIAVQQVEGNLLQPFVMQRAVQLHPALVLFAITAGGVLGGIVGVFLAVPATASLASALGYLRDSSNDCFAS